jgi:microfibrillar-associated protein 1
MPDVPELSEIPESAHMAASASSMPTREFLNESSSEASSDDDDEEEDYAPILYKPVFVPKKVRETILLKENEDAEAELTEKRRLEQLEERKQESHDLVAEHIKREMMEVTESKIDGLDAVDDTDGLDEAAEYEAWKQREFERIRRDRERDAALMLEQEEIERRRGMTDAERMADDKAAGIDRFTKEKTKQQFLQRYYHKGAFFQDEDMLKRDFSAPTLDDRVNKEALPEVMQVKNYGLKGRSKWTHLANEDTSRPDAAWSRKTDITMKTIRKMGGMHDATLERPSVKRQRRDDE